jgi:hypothetical protein
MRCVHTAPRAFWPLGNSLNSVRGMQAVDGPNSSQLEWHQIGVKTKTLVTNAKMRTKLRTKLRVKSNP